MLNYKSKSDRTLATRDFTESLRNFQTYTTAVTTTAKTITVSISGV